MESSRVKLMLIENSENTLIETEFFHKKWKKILVEEREFFGEKPNDFVLKQFFRD